MEHHFNIEIATKYGMDVAVFLNNMSFWIQKNIANNRHYHDGYYWTYNSIDAYQKIFPYFTNKTIRRIIDYCLKNDLILKGNYNENSHDRTCWYAFTEKGLNLFKPLSELICPKGQMHLPEKANGVSRKGKCIKETYNKPDNKQRESTKTSLSTSFDPNDSNLKLLSLKSKEANLTQKEIMDKFRILHQDRKSADWQATLELFLLRERPFKKTSYKPPGKSEVKSSVREWCEGNPDYDRVNKAK